MSITARSDRGHAPPGCENWFVLVNAPALGPQFDWQTEAPAYRRQVLDKLAHAGFDVRAKLRSEVVLLPRDIERLTGCLLYTSGLSQRR